MSSNNFDSENRYQYWDHHRGKIFSSKGGWKAGEDVFCHGYSIMNDLIGNITYMQMLILNATGRLVEKPLADWFEANFICFSWPDPRIWCNQIGALSGTADTAVVAATLAGVLAADSRVYGGIQTSIQGMNFIQEALIKYNSGRTIETIIDQCPKRNNRPQAMGYVRPVNGKDERIQPMERVRKKLNLPVGEHLSLAFEISNYLEDKYDEGINIAGYACAFVADQGFSPQELYCIRATVVSSGVTACYIDTYNKMPDTFLPLRCNDIDYQGIPERYL